MILTTIMFLGLTLEQFILIMTTISSIFGAVVWIRAKLIELETKLADMYVRLTKNENCIEVLNEKLDTKITRFDDKNDADHKLISDKIDVVKDLIGDLKVQISKK